MNSNWNFSTFPIYLHRAHFEYRMDIIERISMQETNHLHRNERQKENRIKKTKWKMMILLRLPLPFHILSIHWKRIFFFVFVYNDKSCNCRQTYVFEMWMHIWFGLGITATTFTTIDWSESTTINISARDILSQPKWPLYRFVWTNAVCVPIVPFRKRRRNTQSILWQRKCSEWEMEWEDVILAIVNFTKTDLSGIKTSREF